ncbi:MAG: hypothetical protein R3E77_02170 [Steroidobacteraceae bacterium]
MKNLFGATLALSAALIVGGCGGSGGDIGPTNTLSGNNNPGGGTTPNTAFRALFQPLSGLLPYPNDIYFSGSTDGTLNIPANPFAPNAAALNVLDGYSTNAVIRANFDGSIDPASLTPAAVVVVHVEVDDDPSGGASPSIPPTPLIPGVDYSVSVVTDAAAGGSGIEIRPLKPLAPSGGIGRSDIRSVYIVLLTAAIQNTAGTAATADTDYATIRQAALATPACNLPSPTFVAICQLVAGHLQIASAAQIPPTNVVVSFSFTVQSTTDALSVLALTATPQTIDARPTGLNTNNVNPLLAGKANIFAGVMQMPYYLNRAAPLSGRWQGNPSVIDPTSREITRFNPQPVATETLPIPVLVTVPNGNSASGGVKPPNGYPVVIFQHGITRNRTDALAIADAFADAGFVVVAIDQPLHGITDPTNPLYAVPANPLYAGNTLPTGANSFERTFDLDLINNATGAPGADGTRDSSGTHYINLTSLATSRDNLRESSADLITVARSLPLLNLDATAGGDIDPNRIHFVGHSLGAIVGTAAAAVTPEIRTASLAMPGGGVAELLRDSVTFGPAINAGLANLGLVPGTTLYAQFFRDTQTVVDAGDPLNYIARAASGKPVHLMQVVGNGTTSLPDQVVPNSATQRLIAAGGLTKLATPGANPSAGGHRAYVNFTAGDHGSILDPTASLATTIEMQTETVVFAASNGQSLPISNPAVIEP